MYVHTHPRNLHSYTFTSYPTYKETKNTKESKAEKTLDKAMESFIEYQQAVEERYQKRTKSAGRKQMSLKKGGRKTKNTI